MFNRDAYMRRYMSKYNAEYYRKNHSRLVADCAARKTHRRIANKLRAVEMFGGICSRCGYSKCVSALEFHHSDKGSKDTGFRSLWGRSWEYITKELAKCTLLCANCHREVEEIQRLAQ